MEANEILALTGGYVDKELLARNEYLAAENEILKSRLEKPVIFNDEERICLAKIGKRIGVEALEEIGCIVKPETIMKWFRDLVAKKFDSSENRQSSGRPKIDPEIEQYVLKFAQENPTWGYDRIAGALANLGYNVSGQTIGNILKRNGISPTPGRKLNKTWDKFIRSHQDVLAACDFFTAEVFTPSGLITFFVLFFINIGTRQVHIAGITPNPDEQWMKQAARNVTMADIGFLSGAKYLLHDRDTKFCSSFREIVKSIGIKPIRLPPKSPNLNAYAERWVRSVKEECLSNLILFAEDSLRNALNEYVEHYHEERNHQGKDNVILFPSKNFDPENKTGVVKCKERLGGLLKYSYREAA